ncbi:hypothetical protein [Halocatena salina]|uniref:Uncharacterized protein n=1 Tax=Halocatena salina TaxID=2934340 RepID=A0A8U0A7H5_9EURY|nr:hypothetical protein [Halocatena salina]UPM44786.1 hypothetical protein MW046_15410 [Halocatena salina]
MNAPSLNVLIVQVTIWEGRSSIHPARYVIERFNENGTLIDGTYEDWLEQFVPSAVGTPEAGV